MIRKIVMACVVASLLALGSMLPASADHNEATWSANQDSFIVDESTVHLEGTDTSVETHDIDLNLAVGDEVSFDYELFNGAKCEAGSPRVFVQPNGNTNHGGVCAGAGSPDNPRSVTFEVEDAGLIDGVGLVYAGKGEGDYVEISNLVINGEPIHFMNPKPEPEVVETVDPTITHPVCEDPGTLTIPAVEGVNYTLNEESVEPDDYVVEHAQVMDVAAVPAEGYELEGDTSWFFHGVAEGCPGDDGSDGEPGSDGKDGVDGTDGADGEDGEDGSVTIETVTVEKTPIRINTGR